MTVVRELAAAVVLACVALGFASPARAEQVMEGVYTYMQEGQPPATWTIYPICVPTVGDLRTVVPARGVHVARDGFSGDGRR